MAGTDDRPYHPYIPTDLEASGAAGGQSRPGNQRAAALQVGFYINRERDLNPLQSLNSQGSAAN